METPQSDPQPPLVPPFPAIRDQLFGKPAWHKRFRDATVDLMGVALTVGVTTGLLLGIGIGLVWLWHVAH